MANYRRAKLSPKQKKGLALLKELRRQINIAIDDIAIDGVSATFAIDKLLRDVKMKELV